MASTASTGGLMFSWLRSLLHDCLPVPCSCSTAFTLIVLPLLPSPPVLVNARESAPRRSLFVRVHKHVDDLYRLRRSLSLPSLPKSHKTAVEEIQTTVG